MKSHEQKLTPFEALNHIEDGGRVVVSLSGSFLSSLFYLVGDEITSCNYEIGACQTGLSKFGLYRHFQKILSDGGEIYAA